MNAPMSLLLAGILVAVCNDSLAQSLKPMDRINEVGPKAKVECDDPVNRTTSK